MIWLTAAIAFFGLCQVAVGVLQYVYGGKQTNNLIIAANRQATASEKIEAAANTQATAAQQFAASTGRLETTIDNAEKDLGRSASNSQKAIEATQDAMKLDQRAWVGMLGISDISFAQENGLLATGVFVNSGKTPARNTKSCIRFRISDTPLSGPSPDDISKITECAPTAAIGPQGRYNEEIGHVISAEPNSPAALKGVSDFKSRYQLIKDEKQFAYIFGIIKYDDVFGNERETDYCIFLADPDKAQIGICDNFNDIK